MAGKAYEFKFERQYAAELLRNFKSNLENAKRVIKDPIKDHTHLVCAIDKCKFRLTMHNRDWWAMASPDPNTAFQKIGEIVKGHAHFAQELKTEPNVGFFNIPVSGSFVTICANCVQNAPLPYNNHQNWRHKCADKSWALPVANKQNSMRFNAQGQLWVLDVPFHNHLNDFLQALPEGMANRDSKNHVWLIADACADEVAGFCTQALKDFGFVYEKSAKAKFEERQKRFAAMANKVSAHHIAAFELLALLTPATLAKVNRIALASLHPDAGGDKGKFQEFQEKWAVVAEKLS